MKAFRVKAAGFRPKRAAATFVVAISLLATATGAASVPAVSSARVAALPDGSAAALAAGRPVDLRLPIGIFRLTATPNDVLAEGAEVVSISDASRVPRPRPPVTTYIGSVSPDMGLRVRLGIDRTVRGIVLQPDGTGWTLIPRTDGGADAVTLDDHPEATGEDGIAVPGVDSNVRADGVPAGNSGTLLLRLALEVDHVYFGFYRTTWEQNVLELVNMTEAIYEQIDVRFRVTSLGAWQTPDPYTAPNACGGGKLEQFSSYWRNDHVRRAIPRDTAHLLTGFMSGSAAGCAYVSQLNTSLAYAVNLFRGGLTGMRDSVNIFAHELGHNFNGRHEKSIGPYGATGLGTAAIVPPYTLMNPSIGAVVFRFSDLDGVVSPQTGQELDNAGAMRSYAQLRLGPA